LKLIKVQIIWKMLATISWLRLFQTYQLSSNSISTKENEFFCTGQKD